jgi:hypothetical protein
MKRIILMLTVAAMLVVAMTVTAGPAFAVNSTQTTCKNPGQCTTTTIHGSHGSTVQKNGQGQGSGEIKNSGTCKRTGSTTTNTC